MKKFFSFLLALFMSASLAVFAEGIEVQPTMQTRTNAQDRVWVGTFQLVWNDFIDKIVHNPIRFREGTPIFVKELNKQSFTVDDISENSFYKMAGKVTKKTKKKISKAIMKKFGETSDLLDKLELVPGRNMLIIYAMLKKDFEFTQEFDILGESDFGQTQTAQYFGINKTSDNSLGEGVEVLFYNSPDDCAVMLATNNKDEVYLYKNPSNKAFTQLYSDMKKKSKAYEGEKTFTDIDELKVPNLKFFEEKSFDELTGKRVMGTNYVINQAMETIRFDMNNKGVYLKSEAAMTVMKTSLLPDLTPRYFNFDDTFVLFLKEKGKKRPYFALRVNDISKFQ